jgi:hypothetical protein
MYLHHIINVIAILSVADPNPKLVVPGLILSPEKTVCVALIRSAATRTTRHPTNCSAWWHPPRAGYRS